MIDVVTRNTKDGPEEGNINDDQKESKLLLWPDII